MGNCMKCDDGYSDYLWTCLSRCESSDNMPILECDDDESVIDMDCQSGIHETIRNYGFPSCFFTIVPNDVMIDNCNEEMKNMTL